MRMKNNFIKKILNWIQHPFGAKDLHEINFDITFKQMTIILEASTIRLGKNNK